jgi:hypothetical protein
MLYEAEIELLLGPQSIDDVEDKVDVALEVE